MIVILNFSGQLLLVLIKLTRVCFRPHSQGPLLPGPSLAPGAEQEKEDDVNTLCDKLATDHSVCTGRATSCTHMSLRQIASCVLETFCENLCLCDRILSLQQVAKKKTLCDLLRRQNSVAATKIFTKGLQYTRSDLSLQKVAATCCCNSCRVVCTDPQDLIETFLSLMMVFHLSGTAKNRSQDCQRFNLWKLTKWSFRWTVRRKTQRCDDLYRGRG